MDRSGLTVRCPASCPDADLRECVNAALLQLLANDKKNRET